MKEETKNIIEVGSDEWESLKVEITEKFADGSLIEKDWLSGRFMIRPFDKDDYSDTYELLKAQQKWVFDYLSLAEDLKRELLLEFKVCLRTVRGEGYEIVPSVEQVQYGYDEFLSDVNKATRKAKMIINHVASLPPENQAKDNDLRAKFSIMQQMLASVKKGD